MQTCSVGGVSRCTWMTPANWTDVQTSLCSHARTSGQDLRSFLPPPSCTSLPSTLQTFSLRCLFAYWAPCHLERPLSAPSCRQPENFSSEECVISVRRDCHNLPLQLSLQRLRRSPSASFPEIYAWAELPNKTWSQMRLGPDLFL